MVAPNGKIYCIPRNSPSVLIIDPETNTADTTSITGLTGTAKWFGGVLAPNGKIYGVPFDSQSVLTIDPASGFIIACALMHPDRKLGSLDLAFLKKRFKEKSFAKGASREQMEGCVKLGLSLDEFLQLCLGAMQKISADLGL